MGWYTHTFIGGSSCSSGGGLGCFDGSLTMKPSRDPRICSGSIPLLVGCTTSYSASPSTTASLSTSIKVNSIYFLCFFDALLFGSLLDIATMFNVVFAYFRAFLSLGFMLWNTRFIILIMKYHVRWSFHWRTSLWKSFLSLFIWSSSEYPTTYSITRKTNRNWTILLEK